MEKKIKITNPKQFEALIAALENAPNLAKGFHRGSTPNNFKEDWENITLKLNSIGPPIRDSDGWQKVWRDFKCKVKRKLVQNKAELNATGGGRYKQLPLSHLEEAAANLMQFQRQLNPEGVAQGIQSSVEEIIVENVSDMDLAILEDDMPTTSADVIRIQEPASNRRKKNRTSDERMELLEKHNDMQKKVFNEISNTMTEIKDVLKETSQYQRELREGKENTMVKIEDYLKETSRFHRKILELEEKKYKIMERRNRREEKLYETEMKLKDIKMKIKKKELEVLEKQYMD